ncbi:MAG: hypothetical protein ACM3S0_14930 [Acidobacteriota bacterium]
MTESILKADEILELEFEYARETAAQAQNDRTTIVNLYLLLVGGVGSIALGLPQIVSDNSRSTSVTLPSSAYMLLFALLGITGFFMLMKLVRLRQAWYESVRAMNQIKKFYLQRFPELDAAFLWKAETIPAAGKPWTITFNLSVLVMLLDSTAIAIAVHMTGLRLPLGDYALDAFAAFIFFAWQLFYYFYQLAYE